VLEVESKLLEWRVVEPQRIRGGGVVAAVRIGEEELRIVFAGVVVLDGIVVGVEVIAGAEEPRQVDQRNGPNRLRCGSRAASAGAAAFFENGENVGEAEEIADARAEVVELEFAFCGFRGDVEADERAEAGAVHIAEVGEVEDNAAFLREQGLYFGLEFRRSFHGQAAGAADDCGVFPGVGVEIELARGRCWRWRQRRCGGHGCALFTLDAAG
jgi:hypothetical protein